MLGIPVQREQTEVVGFSTPKPPAIVCSFEVFSFRPILTQWCLQGVHQEGNIVGMLLRTCLVTGNSVSTACP